MAPSFGEDQRAVDGFAQSVGPDLRIPPKSRWRVSALSTPIGSPPILPSGVKRNPCSRPTMRPAHDNSPPGASSALTIAFSQYHRRRTGVLDRRPAGDVRPKASQTLFFTRRAAPCQCLPAAVRRSRAAARPRSVPEMAHAGEHHREARLVGGRDHFVVAHRAAGLDDRVGAGLAPPRAGRRRRERRRRRRRPSPGPAAPRRRPPARRPRPCGRRCARNRPASSAPRRCRPSRRPWRRRWRWT